MWGSQFPSWTGAGSYPSGVTNRPSARHDLVVFGATGFVGQILCRHLVDRHGIDGPLRWAIAGRDPAKLAQVAVDTGADVERIVVDATDADGLGELAESTRLVASTVGPFARYGSPLIAAVVATGTDYVDLTGEPQWMRRMIDIHQRSAEASGARVVHTCGFDSIPSDLGTWFLQQQSIDRFGLPCSEVHLQVRSLRGGASGGTLASMVELAAEAAADPQVQALLEDPCGLNPPDRRGEWDDPDLTRAVRDPDTGAWLAPFVMAAVNRKVVHRTNALLGRPWGPEFRYQESMAMGRGLVGRLKAAAVGNGLAMSTTFGRVSLFRRIGQRWILPKPGQGPSRAAQERGHWEMRLRGTTPDGRTIQIRVTGDRDPGYGSSARMVGEAAGALLDCPPGEPAGGFWTPASALGDRLIERLEAHAGLRFDVV